MGWRFRHSFKIIPGVRLNLSKTGLSCSIGGAPLTLNVGPRGVYGTASLPGTGVSFRQQLVGGSGTRQEPDSFLPPHSSPDAFPFPLPAAPLRSPPIEEIRSASTELLSSESLKQLKQVIQTAYQEHEEISAELDAARREKQRASDRFLSWENGFLFKRIFKKKFAQRKLELETAEAKIEELEQQLRLTTIATHIEIEKEQAGLYFRMRDEFASLSESAAIWDIKSQQATDRFRERTTAERRVDRQRVAFSLGSCDLIQWEQKVPHLENANGGDLFLYPGFVLYRAARAAFSLIDFRDVKGKAVAVKFQEEQGAPTDSKVIGQTWAKANKDGSRDRRFVGNYEIPVVLYASLTLKSESGLWEEFQFSCPERLERFLRAFNEFVSSLQSVGECARVT
jgi:hypothetical protein